MSGSIERSASEAIVQPFLDFGEAAIPELREFALKKADSTTDEHGRISEAEDMKFAKLSRIHGLKKRAKDTFAPGDSHFRGNFSSR